MFQSLSPLHLKTPQQKTLHIQTFLNVYLYMYLCIDLMLKKNYSVFLSTQKMEKKNYCLKSVQHYLAHHQHKNNFKRLFPPSQFRTISLWIRVIAFLHLAFQLCIDFKVQYFNYFNAYESLQSKAVWKVLWTYYMIYLEVMGGCWDFMGFFLIAGCFLNKCNAFVSQYQCNIRQAFQANPAFLKTQYTLVHNAAQYSKNPTRLIICSTQGIK